MGRPLKYQSVYQHVKDAIQAGTLKPGDALPSEQALTESLGVSRATTTRALQLLQAEGVIERRQGLGSFVTVPRAEDAPPAAVLPPTRTGLVGLVVPFFHYAFGPAVLSAVDGTLARAGHELVIAGSRGDQRTEQAAIRRLVDVGVEGLIVMPVNGEFYSTEILRLHLAGFPVVLIDKWLPGISLPFVTSNNREAARFLTDHLLDLGHEAVAFYSPGLTHTSTLQERFAGYEEALRQRGLTVPPGYVLGQVPDDGKGYWEAQVAAMAAFLTEHPETTAILATDDELAYVAWQAAGRVGYDVPTDLSIVCFDAVVPCPAVWSFTSAIQDQAVIGREAARLILAAVAGEPAGPTEVTVPVSMHMGQSTAAAPRRSSLALRS